VVTPTPEEQLSLGLSPYSKVARLERLRLADDVVMAYEVSVLPQTVLNDPNAVGARSTSIWKASTKRPCAPCSTSAP
jgi:GntR family transcriptional regulator